MCRFKNKRSSVEVPEVNVEAAENLMTREVQRTESWDHVEREKDIRQGIDLATTLERIEKNFVITDPRIPDNPIVSFLDKNICVFIASESNIYKYLLVNFCRFLHLIAFLSLRSTPVKKF